MVSTVTAVQLLSDFLNRDRVLISIVYHSVLFDLSLLCRSNSFSLDSPREFKRVHARQSGSRPDK